MKIKKITSLLLVLTFLIAEISFISFGSSEVVAAPVNTEEYSKNYFGNQLSGQEKKFYDAMVKMYSDGLLQQGKDYEHLIDEGVVTTDQVIAYTTGDRSLLYAMAAARDAFQYDYPEVFWVDWSAMSLRITKDTTGKFHAFLGKGKEDDYLLPGFNAGNIQSAITEFNQLLDKAVADIRDAANDVMSDNNTVKLLRAAHDWEMTQMHYKFEYQVDGFGTDTPHSNARTAYDCLKYGTGVCEAYTRGFKAIADKLNIPCICVFGGYKASEVRMEDHIWNYVKVGDTWYGIDVTHDDDENPQKESRKFFLVGKAELYSRRVASGVMSEANYTFTYPTLPTSGLIEFAVQEGSDENRVISDGLLKAKFRYTDHTETGDGSHEVEADAMEVWVSYNGKNYSENAKEGKYILIRYGFAHSGDWKFTDWSYMNVDQMLMSDHLEYTDGVINTDPDLGNYVKLPFPQVELCQFAITNIAPEKIVYGQDHVPDQSYKGDIKLLDEITPEIINKSNNIYKAAPYTVKAEPVQYVKLVLGESYDCRVEWDDSFVADVPDTNGELKITEILDARNEDRSDLIDSASITNVEYDLGGEGRNASVKFKFTPSIEFAANEVAYEITWTGVKGSNSGKAPLPASYAVGAPCDFHCLAGQGIDCNVFAQPRLMDVSDVDSSNWEVRNPETGELEALPDGLKGVDLSDLTHRLTLTTTSVAEDDSEEMLDKIGSEINKNTAVTETYNISMQLCKKQIVRTGNTVRVRLGFPKGTSYDDYKNGLREFKVYHYNYDEFGKITSYDIVPVEVTPQGLILFVNSFSPYTIAADVVPAEKQEEVAAKNQEKVLMISASEGGTIKHDGSEKDKIDMKDVESVNLTITPKEGKDIESVAVGTKTVNVSDLTKNDNGSYTLTVKTAELAEGSTLVYVQFMSKAVIVADEEAGNGEEVEQPEETPGTHIPDPDVDPEEGGFHRFHVVNATSGKTVSELMADIANEGLSFTIVDKDGNTIANPETARVATGMKIKIKANGSTAQTSEETIVVKGDITGDGKMSATDITLARREVLSANLEGCYKEAADFNSDGKVGATDITLLRRGLLSAK